MRSAGRALTESFVLHGLLAGALIAMAGSFTPPPRTIRLDFRMLEQAAAPAPKAAEAAPAPIPPVASPTPPVPRSQPKVQTAVVAPPKPKPVPAKIKPAPPKAIRPETPKAVAVVPTPAPAPAALPAVAAPTAKTPSSLKNAADTDQAAPTASVNDSNHGQTSAPTAGASGAGEPTVTAGEEYRRANFGLIRDAILGNLRYPMAARRRGWSGQVEVAFMIAPDGSVSELRIQASSGFPVLDDQALAAIRRSAPFPPPRIAALLVMPVSFQLN